MLGNYGYGTLLGVLLLIAAIPYVARIRHPRQKPFAAYLIFVTVLAASFAVLFSLLTWAAGALGLGERLGATGPALLLILTALLPSLAVATWQARRPPTARPPPG
jgi:hypothetical protein